MNPLARMANLEDGCKGRFWEGRFQSQQLLDDMALLACMVYIDLNPLRAGIESDVTKARHTSLARRLRQQSLTDSVRTLNTPHVRVRTGYSLEDYLSLVNWTAIAQSSHRPIPGSAQSALVNIGALDTALWLEHYQPRPGYWQRAMGSVNSLRDYARSLGQRWIRTRSAAIC